jgi:hypothetical protein
MNFLSPQFLGMAAAVAAIYGVMWSTAFAPRRNDPRRDA